MIGAAAVELAGIQKPIIRRRREDNSVIVGTPASTPTYANSDEFFQMFRNRNSSSTYETVPIITEKEEENLYISPVKASFVITAPVVFLGRGTQPPIDETDDLVIFDE